MTARDSTVTYNLSRGHPERETRCRCIPERRLSTPLRAMPESCCRLLQFPGKCVVSQAHVFLPVAPVKGLLRSRTDRHIVRRQPLLMLLQCFSPGLGSKPLVDLVLQLMGLHHILGHQTAPGIVEPLVPLVMLQHREMDTVD